MTTTPDSALDFVQCLSRDIKALQEGMAELTQSTEELKSGWHLERKQRASEVNAVHERISQESAVQTQMRSALTSRCDDFEGKTKQWVGALGKESMAMKERLNALDGLVAELTTQQASSSSRLQAVETSTSQRFDLAEAQALVAKVADLSAAVDCDRASAKSAVEACGAKCGHDLRLAQERLDTLSYQVEANKKSLSSDLSTLSANVEALDAFANTRAKQVDFHALTLTVQEAERSLQKAHDDLATKAAALSLNAVSDRLTSLTMDVNANLVRAQAGDDALSAQLSELSQNLAKTSRQLDSDRDRWSACAVALEKDLNNRTLKTEAEALGSRLIAVEEVTNPLPQVLANKASSTEMASVKAQMEALQAGFTAKANASDLARAELTVAEQAGKCEMLQHRSQEQSTRLEKLSAMAQERGEQLDALASTSAEMQGQMLKKVTLEEVHSKESMELLLRGYYPKEEMDAQLSRVWWRVGDMAKPSRVATPLSPFR